MSTLQGSCKSQDITALNQTLTSYNTGPSKLVSLALPSPLMGTIQKMIRYK